MKPSSDLSCRLLKALGIVQSTGRGSCQRARAVRRVSVTIAIGVPTAMNTAPRIINVGLLSASPEDRKVTPEHNKAMDAGMNAVIVMVGLWHRLRMAGWGREVNHKTKKPPCRVALIAVTA